MAIIQGHAKSSGVTAFYPKTIDQSLRFNYDDNPYLIKTTGAGNRRTYTISLWFKLGDTGGRESSLFSSGASGSGYVDLTMLPADTLEFYIYPSNLFRTNRVLRDPSAWYHVVVSVDTTQATASERVKIWLNGEQQTGSLLSYEQQPTLNYDTPMGVASSFVDIGAYFNVPYQEFDGYIAEVHFTDGTAYDADTFGELKSGIWVPKDVAVTYGTNGFHLEFANPAAIGDDTSGNTNDFTANNLVASDVVPDSPTNSWCVMNPELYVAGNNCTYSEGNLKVLRDVSNWESVHSTMAVNSGKWYWEVYISGTNHMISVCDPNSEVGEIASVYTRTGLWTLQDTGYRYLNFVNDSTYNGLLSFASGDVMMVAMDVDAGNVYIGKNGTWFISGDPVNGGGEMFTSVFTDSGFVAPASTFQTANAYQHFNFGQDSTFAGTKSAGGNSDANGIGDFQYTVPSGYLALCTSNLPDPVIDPAQDDSPEDYMNVVTYTGASALTVDTGLPSVDMVWIKSRSAVYLPRIIDSIRGDNTAVYTADTATEGSYSVNDDCELNTPTDGNLYFDVTNGGTNGSGVSTVAWAWKAGGTGVSNTDGSITSTVSANTDAGFSIVGYNGTQVAGDTVGHGLTQAPEMIIVKKRGGATSDWSIYHKDLNVNGDNLPETDFLEFDTNSAADSSAEWDDTAPTSTVFSLGNGTQTNDGGSGGIPHIAYCFHSVDQYCKVGSYIGNSQADGVFVYTGFRPKWIMVKSTVEVSAPYTGWCIIDAETMSFNADEQGTQLWANAAYAEGKRGQGTTDATVGNFDLLSNGFKLRNNLVEVNYTGQQYIFLAFAEQPVKYSNAR